jgi:hypothetical protein
MKMEVKFEITIYVNGVKKRCRKPDRHALKLGSIDYNDGNFNKEEIVEKARAIVAENMKTIESPLQVSMLRMEIKREEGITSRVFEMFDKRHVNFKIEATALNQALV